ncbi:HAD hydrolase-like protein [Hufsiella ginkgonis]|uniref:HAD hydrolase-like protein n=1 Tax=Hufsiella ginkgonis TaxID=2695274 RepID=A0A7K1XZB2_9SPHI|nr:HAD hydrolase-like protein [Hufsiella ginkgonis]MXV16310.1 HAD hydrolase-like protein [Hufsiella ginkgonis]
MLNYADLDPAKKAFIFELDNVLYPERDYLLQVYYLFANFIEYTEGFPPAADLTSFFKTSLDHHGAAGIFDRALAAFALDEKYRRNFGLLHQTARLPLKLLLYKPMLELLQEIVVDRKKIFLVTDGDPGQQLNKIRQIEWHGLEKHLTVYFTAETNPKPETDVLNMILAQHNILRKELLIIGTLKVDEEFADAAGIDYLDQGFLR